MVPWDQVVPKKEVRGELIRVECAGKTARLRLKDTHNRELSLLLRSVAEAGLSFLGLGIRPPTPSWGLMLGESFQFARGYYYMVLFPAVLVALTMLGFTLMGDGLRDALDPRMGD